MLPLEQVARDDGSAGELRIELNSVQWPVVAPKTLPLDANVLLRNVALSPDREKGLPHP